MTKPTDAHRACVEALCRNIGKPSFKGADVTDDIAARSGYLNTKSVLGSLGGQISRGTTRISLENKVYTWGHTFYKMCMGSDVHLQLVAAKVQMAIGDSADRFTAFSWLGEQSVVVPTLDGHHDIRVATFADMLAGDWADFQALLIWAGILNPLGRSCRTNEQVVHLNFELYQQVKPLVREPRDGDPEAPSRDDIKELEAQRRGDVPAPTPMPTEVKAPKTTGRDRVRERKIGAGGLKRLKAMCEQLGTRPFRARALDFETYGFSTMDALRECIRGSRVDQLGIIESCPDLDGIPGKGWYCFVAGSQTVQEWLDQATQSPTVEPRTELVVSTPAPVVGRLEELRARRAAIKTQMQLLTEEDASLEREEAEEKDRCDIADAADLLAKHGFDLDRILKLVRERERS